MSSLHTANNFIGLDLFHPPPQLGTGMLTQADNLLVDGGDLVTRPGFGGCFAAPLPGPLYCPTPFLDADGTSKIVFVSSGRLYKWAKGTTAPVEIVIPGASGAINGPGSRITRLGHYGYLVDGTLGLVRFDLSGGKIAPTLSTPAPPPIAALTSTVLDTLLTGAWTPDTLTGPGQVNRLPNSDFSAVYAVGGGSLPTGYTAYGADPDDGGSPPAGYTGHWLNLDTPAEGIALTAALANDPVAGDPARAATQFYAAVDAVQLDHTGASSVIYRVLGYSDLAGTLPAGEAHREFALPYNGGQRVTVGGVFSFASATVPILSFRIQLEAGERNVLGSGTAVYVKNWVCFPFALGAAAARDGQLAVSSPGTLAYTGGTLAQTSPGEVGAGRGAGGLHLSHDYGAPQDWHSFDRLTLTLGKALGITQDGTVPPEAGPVLRLAFRQAGSAVRHYTNPLRLAADGSYASVDISTVDLAVRSSFRYLEVVLGGDYTVPVANGGDLLLLGPLTGAGNLGLNALGTGYAYYYVYTEVDANGDVLLANVIQSNPSALSNTITATPIQAEAAVTLPSAPANPAATLFYLWRFGGVFSDGLARLITKRRFTDAFAYGMDPGQPGSLGDRVNPYLAYAPGFLTDNTPDLFLLGAETLVQGRDAPPIGATALCAWQARLWLAKGGTLYASWAVTLDQQDALYFTSANLAADPLASVKGATFSIGQDDADAVQALLPIATNAFFSKGFLGILKQHSVWLLSGTNPANFALQSYLLGAGRGCIAPRGACLVEGQIWYTRSDGISAFNGDQPTNQSQPVEALLRPPEGAVQQLPAAYAAAALTYHGRRVWCFVPVPGAALNTSALVYDTRQGGWTRLLTPFGATGAASASSETDNDDLYLAGSDGQLYQVTGQADRALSGGAVAPISFAAKTRGMGQGSGLGLYTDVTATRAFATLLGPAVVTATVSVDTPAGTLWGQAYTFPAGGEAPRLRVAPGVKGDYHIVGITGAASARTRVRSLALESAETGMQL